MDHESFDALARRVIAAMGTRRAVLRLVAGSVLGSGAARQALHGEVEAKRKRKRASSRHEERSRPPGRHAGGSVQAQGKHKKKHSHKPKKDRQKPEPCPEGQGRCPDGTCLPWDACCPDAVPPLCTGCQEEVCEAGQLVCRSKCQYTDSVCCKGECYLPCTNGCQMSDDCSSCKSAPAGKAYCAAQDRCVSTSCPSGQDFDPESCQCKEHCPFGTSIACPPVPAHSDWKGIFGDEYPLPAGCCGMRYWWLDTDGVTNCSTPGHHVPPVNYRCDG